MTTNKFSFDKLSDLVTPRELIKTGYPGGKTAVYALFNRADFPAIRHGRKFLITKKALICYFESA